MRPVRRGPSPRSTDFGEYSEAKAFLIDRLGPYCSYCERRVTASLAVEHIQPKGLAQYAHLSGRWENFLLACVNCNSTKKDKDVQLADTLLPDRDNSFVALEYAQDGTVRPSPSLAHAHGVISQTIALVGLNRPLPGALDENGNGVALDRKSQRMEAWLAAKEARSTVESCPDNEAVLRMAVALAVATGFFSIWFHEFKGNSTFRNRLIDAFNGTRQSACFDPETATPQSPAPNPDALPNGGKT